MTKTGIVTQVNKNVVYLMTSSGEFVKVRARGAAPGIGEIYSGEPYIERKIFRLPAIAAAMLSFIILSSGLYTYYTPVAAITIDINPSVKLHINRWNKIIKAAPLNEDGEKILLNLSLANKSPEEGLELIVAQAEKDNFINEEYKASDKIISVHVVEQKEDQVNLSGFQAAVEKQNLKVAIKEDIKNKKEAVKEITKPAGKLSEDLNKNNPNSSEAQENKTQDNKEKNQGQEKKEEKDNAEDKIESKSNNSSNGVDNSNNQKNKNNASDKNQANSDQEEKKENSNQKKDDKNQDKESDKQEDKSSKSNNGNSSGNNSKNEKGNKK